MKKANLKIIFASLGALSIASTGVGVISCGTSQTPNGDKTKQITHDMILETVTKSIYGALGGC